MTPCTVKCVNCNVVIDELLTFIMNKVDVMDQESLMRICMSTFSVEEVENSKKLLFESISTDIRNVKRKKKNDGKIQRDLEDILTVIKGTDPEKIPIFVAKELHKLPPVTFDHIDVTCLLKDIVLLKSQLEHIKNSYATTEQLNELRGKLDNNKYDSLLFCTPNHTPSLVNKKVSRAKIIDNESPSMIPPVAGSTNAGKRSGALSRSNQCDMNAPELGVGPSTNNQCVISGESETKRCALETGMSETELPTISDSVERYQQDKDKNIQMTGVCEKQTFASVTRTETLNKNPNNGQWTLVQNKRKLNKFTTSKGRACIDDNCKFKPADTKIPLFITNVHKDVSEKDVAEYIFSKTQEEVMPIKIKMTRERNYSAFKIFVKKTNMSTYLDDSMWPMGISFRRFIHLKGGGEVNSRRVTERQSIIDQNG